MGYFFKDIVTGKNNEMWYLKTHPPSLKIKLDAIVGMP
jgi:hypothetical protein